LGEIQRARILAAMQEVAVERGAGNVSVSHVVERSGVSRRTFYETFKDRDDCFLAAFEDALSLAARRIVPAYRSASGWRQRIRRGLVALLAFLDEEPAAGRLLLCESLSGVGGVSARRGEVVGALVDAVEEGRKQSRVAAALPPLTGEGVVGGVLAILQDAVARSREEQPAPADLVNQLMGMIVMPYLGLAAARRELEHPLERSPAGGEPRGGPRLSQDPFKGLGMRLTYRTVRVLTAVAERPGASNRTIGRAADISDQGQASKLLGRLRRLGLVENDVPGPGQGAPNAWRLTEAGRQIAKSIQVHANGPIDTGEACR
jgi:AcrR family transcriptional regulator